MYDVIIYQKDGAVLGRVSLSYRDEALDVADLVSVLFRVPTAVSDDDGVVQEY